MLENDMNANIAPNGFDSFSDRNLPHKGALYSSENFELNKVEIKENLKSKSSLRMRYEAEASVIKKKLGNLDDIRTVLGLSQRKICQLLLVDPSAWTRWTRQNESAPPHIYRMLQWYLALEGKYPALDAGFWLSAVSRSGSDDLIADQSREILRLRQAIDKLNHEILELRVEQGAQNLTRQKDAQHFKRMVRKVLLAVLLGGAILLIILSISGLISVR